MQKAYILLESLNHYETKKVYTFKFNFLEKKMKKERNIFLKSLKTALMQIKKKKLFFFIMFFTQLAFILLVSFIFVKYSIQIGTNAQAIIEPLTNISAEMTPYETSEMIAALGPTVSAYAEMKHDIFMMFILVFLSYLIINGLNWNLAHRVVNESGDCLKNHSMFLVSTLLFTAVGLVLGGFFLQLIAFAANRTIGSLLFLVLVVLVTYFAYISFSLECSYSLKQVKKFFADTFKLGYKKFGVLISAYFFMWLPTAVIFALIYKLLFVATPLLILFIILFVISLNFGRIFFVSVVKNLKEKNSLNINKQGEIK